MAKAERKLGQRLKTTYTPRLHIPKPIGKIASTQLNEASSPFSYRSKVTIKMHACNILVWCPPPQTKEEKMGWMPG